jgi:hypothetical protein
MIIPGQFGFNYPSGFREEAFWNIFMGKMFQNASSLKPLGQLKKFLFLVTVAILNGRWGCRTQYWKGPTQGPSLPGLV